MPAQTILGLDLSLTETGIYISDWKETSPISAVLKPPKGIDQFNRLLWYENKFIDLFKEHKIKYCAVEGYAFATGFAKGSRTFSIGEQGGIARVRLMTAGVVAVVVPPTTLKKFVCGKGNVKKNEMILGIYKKWGKEFGNDNKADAFALYQFARMYFFKDPITKGEEELCKGVEVIELPSTNA